jgi:hypothetical protein
MMAKKKTAAALDVETETERLFEEIEEQYPPAKCSLAEYREVLRDLEIRIHDRILMLNAEIGRDE